MLLFFLNMGKIRREKDFVRCRVGFQKVGVMFPFN